MYQTNRFEGKPFIFYETSTSLDNEAALLNLLQCLHAPAAAVVSSSQGHSQIYSRRFILHSPATAIVSPSQGHNQIYSRRFIFHAPAAAIVSPSYSHSQIYRRRLIFHVQSPSIFQLIKFYFWVRPFL